MKRLPLILDGRAVRESVRARLAKEFARRTSGALVIVQVGANEASNAYIAQKKKFGAEIGVHVVHESFPETIAESALIANIATYNADDSVAGIIVQLPLPAYLNQQRIQNAVAVRTSKSS